MYQPENMFYDKNAITQFPMGIIVLSKRTNYIGHVVGLGLNSTDEVLITVKFANGETFNIHPKHLEVL